MRDLSDIIYSAVSTLLRPLVRILLRNNIPFATFVDLAKRVYVESAMEDFPLPGRKQTVSRAALLTGLSRKEVLRVTRLAPPKESIAAEQHSRGARVITGWIRDERFHNAENLPADLSFDGEAGSFVELVREYSGDMTPRAVLDELLRVGVLERLPEGKIRLLTPGYLPSGDAEKLHILGTDAADLIRTVDHNLGEGDGKREPYFQRKVCYHSFPAAHLDELRRRTREKGQALLEELDRWMAVHDPIDQDPDDPTLHRRVGVGIYYFESERNEEEDNP